MPACAANSIGASLLGRNRSARFQSSNCSWTPEFTSRTHCHEWVIISPPTACITPSSVLQNQSPRARTSKCRHLSISEGKACRLLDESDILRTDLSAPTSGGSSWYRAREDWHATHRNISLRFGQVAQAWKSTRTFSHGRQNKRSSKHVAMRKTKRDLNFVFE